MDFRIAIPSYKRSDVISDLTLRVLLECNIDPGIIDIFVADKEEDQLYKKEVHPMLYNRIIIGRPGMKGIRHFIQDYYDEGACILNLDDDIKSIFYNSGPKKLIPIGKKLITIIEKGFDLCFKHNIGLWGVYPVNNPYFMQTKISTDLRFIMGTFWGCINTHDKSMYITLDDKEDHERTLQFFMRDGAVIRFNYVCFDNAIYTQKGGMQYDGKRTKKRIRDSAYYLINKYPLYCHLHKIRDGRVEILLKDKLKCK